MHYQSPLLLIAFFHTFQAFKNPIQPDAIDGTAVLKRWVIPYLIILNFSSPAVKDVAAQSSGGVIGFSTTRQKNFPPITQPEVIHGEAHVLCSPVTYSPVLAFSSCFFYIDLVVTEAPQWEKASLQGSNSKAHSNYPLPTNPTISVKIHDISSEDSIPTHVKYAFGCAIIII